MKNFIITILAAASVFTNSFAWAAEATKTTQIAQDIQEMSGVLSTHKTVGGILNYNSKFGFITNQEVQDTLKVLNKYGVDANTEILMPQVSGNNVKVGSLKLTLVDQNTIRNADGKSLKIRQQYESFDKSMERLLKENGLTAKTAKQSLFINSAYATEYTLGQNIAGFVGITGLLLLVGGIAMFSLAAQKTSEFFNCDLKAKLALSKEEQQDLESFLKFNKDKIANSFRVACAVGKDGKPIFAPYMAGDKIDQKVEYSFLEKAEKCSKKIAEASSERKNVLVLFDGKQDTDKSQSLIHRLAFDGKATVCDEKTSKEAEQKIKEQLRSNRTKLSSLFAESLNKISSDAKSREEIYWPAQNGRGTN